MKESFVGAHCAIDPKRIIKPKAFLQDFHHWACFISQKVSQFEIDNMFVKCKKCKEI